MNRSVPLVFVLFFLAASGVVIIQPVVAAEDSWETKKSLPHPGSYLTGTVLDDKIFIINFSPKTGYSYEYDPAQDKWTQHTPPPAYNFSPAIVGYQGKIWAFGGGQIQVYDPSTGSWARRCGMPTERYNSIAYEVNGKFYVIGGGVPSRPPGEGTTAVRDIEVFDPPSYTWTTKKPAPRYATSGDASALLDEKIYVVDSETQVYDTQTDTWSTAPSCPYPPNGAAGAAVTSGVLAPKRIYVMGGFPGDIYVYDYNRVYDPENSSWSLAESMPTALQGFVIAAVNDKIYTFGGNTGIPYPPMGVSTDHNYQYTPIGYGKNSTSTPTPTANPTFTPTPTTTPTPTPSPSPSPTPTQQPTLEPTQSAQPTTPPNGNDSSDLILGIAAVAIVTIAIAGLMAYFTKIKKKTTN
jgi:hypothetical protein